MPRKKKDSVEHIELTQEELNNIVKPKKNKNHYIDNKLFFQEMIDWKKKVNEAHDQGDPIPPVSDYIGLCFYEIAQNLAKKPNFMNYQFKDDMIGDGIENCLMYCSNFDPDKSNNPFSYFTQIIYYAFLRRIMKERKQSYVKNKMIQELPMEVFDQLEGDDAFYSNQYIDFRRSTQNFDDYIERRKQKKMEDRLKRSMGLDELALDNGDTTDEDSDNN